MCDIIHEAFLLLESRLCSSRKHSVEVGARCKRNFLDNLPAALQRRAILEDTPGGKDPQVERMRPAQNQLGGIAPNRVALLEAVPREAVRQVETSQFGPFSQDGV